MSKISYVIHIHSLHWVIDIKRVLHIPHGRTKFVLNQVFSVDLVSNSSFRPSFYLNNDCQHHGIPAQGTGTEIFGQKFRYVVDNFTEKSQLQQIYYKVDHPGSMYCSRSYSLKSVSVSRLTFKARDLSDAICLESWKKQLLGSSMINIWHWFLWNGVLFPKIF